MLPWTVSTVSTYISAKFPFSLLIRSPSVSAKRRCLPLPSFTERVIRPTRPFDPDVSRFTTYPLWGEPPPAFFYLSCFFRLASVVSLLANRLCWLLYRRISRKFLECARASPDRHVSLPEISAGLYMGRCLLCSTPTFLFSSLPYALSLRLETGMPFCRFGGRRTRAMSRRRYFHSSPYHTTCP